MKYDDDGLDCIFGKNIDRPMSDDEMEARYMSEQLELMDTDDWYMDDTRPNMTDD